MVALCWDIANIPKNDFSSIASTATDTVDAPANMADVHVPGPPAPPVRDTIARPAHRAQSWKMNREDLNKLWKIPTDDEQSIPTQARQYPLSG